MENDRIQESTKRPVELESKLEEATVLRNPKRFAPTKEQDRSKSIYSEENSTCQLETNQHLFPDPGESNDATFSLWDPLRNQFVPSVDSEPVFHIEELQSATTSTLNLSTSFGSSETDPQHLSSESHLEQTVTAEISKEFSDDPELISWLAKNFHADSRSLLSRELVFEMYKKFAKNSGKTLMNSACLGKVMRRVFPMMKTRRLGKRGDSKYHYSGIDLIQSTENQKISCSKELLRPITEDPDELIENEADFLNCRSITGEKIKIRRKKRRNKTASILDEEIATWLRRNFQSNQNSVIPRDFVFKKYRQLCTVTGKLLMNPACFGKTLRVVFSQTETRRLGSRGNSKYHYAGIEINPNGDFAQQFFSTVARRQKLRAVSKTLRSKISKNTGEFLQDQEVVEIMEILKVMMVPKDDDDDYANHCLIPAFLRKKSSWSSISSTFRPSSPIHPVDVDDFFFYFRIHIAMIGHSFVSGAFLALPEIFENFWVTRTKSLQVPGGYSRQIFDRIIALASTQEAIKRCYLSVYDLLIQRLKPTVCSVMSIHLTYVITDFLNKFPFWIRNSTTGMNDLNVRAVICHSAGAFAVQLEKLTRLSMLEEEISVVDSSMKTAFNRYCLDQLSKTVSMILQCEAESFHSRMDRSRRTISAVACMLEQPRDLSRLEVLIRRSISAEFSRLAEQFCGLRLVREKEEALAALQAGWNDALGSLVGGNDLAQLIVTSWQLTLSLLVDRESAALRKNLPTESVFKAIFEQLGTEIPDIPPGSLDLALNFFSENNIQNLGSINSKNLQFFLQSSDLQSFLNSKGNMIPLDFRDNQHTDRINVALPLPVIKKICDK